MNTTKKKWTYRSARRLLIRGKTTKDGRFDKEVYSELHFLHISEYMSEREESDMSLEPLNASRRRYRGNDLKPSSCGVTADVNTVVVRLMDVFTQKCGGGGEKGVLSFYTRKGYLKPSLRPRKL